MKKILLVLITGLLFIPISGLSANYKQNEVLIYKQAIISRDYLRENLSYGEKLLQNIELFFNDIRKNNDKKKLEILIEKTSKIILKYKNKEILNKNEKLVYELSKNLFYRSIIEINR